MKFEYERLSSGTHTLSHDQMEDRPVYVVNVEDGDVMESCVDALHSIRDNCIKLSDSIKSCDDHEIGQLNIEITPDESEESFCIVLRFKVDVPPILHAVSMEDYMNDYVLPKEIGEIQESIYFLTDVSEDMYEVIEDMVRRLS